VGNDSYGLQLLAPVKPSKVPDVHRWDRRRQACVLAAGRLGQDLGQRHLHPRHVLWIQLVEVRAHEAAVERGRDVVRVALDHEREVQQAGFGQLQVAADVGERHAGDDRGAGTAEAAAERDGVADVHVRAGREGALVVAPEDVERCAGEQVLGRVEVDAVCADAGVGDCAVEWVGGRGLFVGLGGDGEFEVH